MYVFWCLKISILLLWNSVYIALEIYRRSLFYYLQTLQKRLKLHKLFDEFTLGIQGEGKNSGIKQKTVSILAWIEDSSGLQTSHDPDNAQCANLSWIFKLDLCLSTAECPIIHLCFLIVERKRITALVFLFIISASEQLAPQHPHIFLLN